MISERQRGGITQRVVYGVQRLREWVREHIRLTQKPELDEKVRGIDVKKVFRRKVILSLRSGVGASFGRRMAGLGRRLGGSVARIFGF